MFRLFECCALSFFERFVLSFSLKIERFVSDSAEIWICGLYNSFRLLVAGLRVVNGPFTSQKPATFYTQTALLFFAFNNLTYYGFLFYGIKHLSCQSGVLFYFEYQKVYVADQRSLYSMLPDGTSGRTLALLFLNIATTKKRIARKKQGI